MLAKELNLKAANYYYNLVCLQRTAYALCIVLTLQYCIVLATSVLHFQILWDLITINLLSKLAKYFCALGAILIRNTVSFPFF